jgi:pyruvate formate lyase activating enzyme
VSQQPTPHVAAPDSKKLADARGTLIDLDTFAVHDGPGIRMAVYLKGCPLSCVWCHSPESQRADPELIYVRERCVMCGACVATCPRGAHAFVDGHHIIQRALCSDCGACVTVCPSGAVAIKGYTATAAEIVDRAVRMKPFFAHSGGGITLTGGEVTAQADFAEAVLAGCHAAGIHTAIETCGACAWSELERMLPYTDLVLYDIKLADDTAHRRWTRASNRAILENAARLAGRDVEMQVRVPLVPGITDTNDNLSTIFALMRGWGLSSIALLPYNEAAGAKYEWLDLPYPLEARGQSRETLAVARRMALDAGLDAVIG